MKVEVAGFVFGTMAAILSICAFYLAGMAYVDDNNIPGSLAAIGTGLFGISISHILMNDALRLLDNE